MDFIQNIYSDKRRRRDIIKGVQNKRRNKKLKKFGVFLIKAMIFTLAISFVMYMALKLVPVSTVTVDNPLYSKVEAKEIEPEFKVVVAQVTAYTSSVDETDSTPFETASGARTRDGILACPPKYEFGTVIEIKGKNYVCEDRMNRRYHNQERFDIWVETKDVAYEWGLQEVEVKVY